MAQVKKFQQGTGQGGITPVVNQQKKYKVKVDGRDFEVDEDALDTHFETGFKDLVEKGYAKEKDRSDWYNAFKDFKGQIGEGTEIDMTGKTLGGINLPGTLSKEQLGLDEEGKTATSSRFGRFVKGGVKDPAQRNALLHGMLGQSIGQSAGLAREEFDAKKKVDDETAKTKRTAEIETIVNRLDPSKRGFGVNYLGENEGGDQKFNLDYYWDKGKTDLDRNYMYGKAVANLGKKIFDKEYDDPEVMAAAKAKGWDVEALRQAYKGQGFDPSNPDALANMYKKKGTKAFEQFHNTLDILKSDMPFYNRAAYDASKAPVNTSGTTTGTTTGAEIVDATGTGSVNTTIPETQEAKPNTGWKLQNGVLTRGGQPFSGFRYHAPFSSSNSFYVEGKPASRTTANQYIKTHPASALDFETGYKESLAKHSDFITKQGFTKLEKKEGTYRPETFAFNDLLKSSNEAYAKDSSSDFTGVNKDTGNLFEYVAFKGPKENPTAVRKYRYYDKAKHTYHDGSLVKDPLTGNFTFKSDSGKFNINVGAPKNTLSQEDQENRGNLYFKPLKNTQPKGKGETWQTEGNAVNSFLDSFTHLKDGGVIKHQSGGDLQRAVATTPNTTKQRSTASTKDVRQLNLSTSDKWKLGGLAADMGGLIASFTGAGSLVGAGAGVAGSTASFVGDIKNDRDTWESAKDLGVNVGLDVLSAVPVLGLSAKVPKVAKALKASKTVLNAYFISQGLTAGVQSLKKIDNPDDMTIDDWRNIVGGIQAVLSGKRAIDSKVATNKTQTHSVKANGKAVELTPEQAKLIFTAKGRDAKMTAAKSAVAEKLGIKPEEVNIESTVSSSKLKMALNPLNMINKGVRPDVSVQKGSTLKDVDEYTGPGVMNWYMRSAIRNTAMSNPLMVGSDKLLAPRFRQNANGKYVQVFEGNNGGPSLLGSRKNTYISKEGDISKVPTEKTTAPIPPVDAKPKTDAANITPPTPEPKPVRPKKHFESKYKGVKKSPVNKSKYKQGGVLFAKKGTRMGPPTLLEALNGPMGSTDPISSPIAVRASSKYNLVDPGSVGSGAVQPENKLKLGLLGKVSKYINPSDLSELGRAAFISRHNAGEDTNVTAALMSPGLELPSSTRGNLLLKSIFDKRATDVMQSGKRNISADPTLNRLAQLSLTKQASDISQEGTIRDAEALDKSLAMDEERQQQYADRRMDVANRNVGALAAKSEAERQLNNLKRDKVVQPYEDLWMQKNQEMKDKAGMMKQFKTKAAVAQMQQKYAKELAPHQRILDTYAGRKDLTPEENTKFQNAYENINLLQSKMDEEAMGIYGNPEGYESNVQQPSSKSPYTSKGFTFVPTKKEGGKVVDRELEIYKQQTKSAQEREKSYNRMFSEKYLENRKHESKTRDRIHDLIKMAIK